MKMFVDPPAIYLHRDPVDFRKAVNGLALIVEQQMELSLFSDSLFVFCNKAEDKVKVLYWDKTGFCLWYKRLEKERFKWPRKYPDAVMTLSEDKWQSLLSGYSILAHEAVYFSSCSG
jgi:transposase